MKEAQEKSIDYHIDKLERIMKKKKFTQKRMGKSISIGKNIAFASKISKENTLFGMGIKKEGFMGTLWTGTTMPNIPGTNMGISLEAIIEELSIRLKEKEFKEEFELYLWDLIKEKGMTIEHLAVKSNINEIYLERVLEGTEKLSKEKAIKIGISLSLNHYLIIDLLARLGYILRPNSYKYDYLIFYCIENKLDVEYTDKLIRTWKE